MTEQRTGISEALGIRPTSVQEGRHPDGRECPPWCYVRLFDYNHEVQPARPGDAQHMLDQYPAVPSILYEANAKDSPMRLATIESDLRQVGGGHPTIRVSVRRYPLRRQGDGSWRTEHDFSSRLLLTMTEGA